MSNIRFSIQRSAATSTVFAASSSFKDFFDEHLSVPRITSKKDGKAFIPAAFRGNTRNNDSVINSQMLVFDIDQKLGDKMISLEEMEDALYDMDLEHAIYTSYSNRAECPRFRVIVPLSRPIYREEYLQIAAAMLEDLDEYLDGRMSKVIDPCWKVISQCYYTFTVHPDHQDGSVAFYNPGREADADDLKVRCSSYGLDTEYKSKGGRKGIAGVGAKGRSYSINQLIGAMYKTADAEEIARRAFEYDQEQHGDDPYFYDYQYSCNQPKPGESRDAAAWRACLTFVKSHLSSISRKDKKQDFTIIEKRGVNSGPLPQHDAAIQVWKVEDQSKDGKQRIKLSCKVMSGEHAGSIFWHTLFGKGYSEKSEQITVKIAQKIGAATKTDIRQPEELPKIVGKIFIGRVKRVPGTNGFPDQNQIGGVYRDTH